MVITMEEATPQFPMMQENGQGDEGAVISTLVAKVNNVSVSTTKSQLEELFSFLGEVQAVHLFPGEDSSIPVQTRVAYIQFNSSEGVNLAQHITNTMFLDKPLIVMAAADNEIPTEEEALKLIDPVTVAKTYTVAPGHPSLEAPYDPTLASLGLPQPPALPTNTDPSKVDDIRRTIYVGNLDSQSVTGESVLNFFNSIGAVKYVRMAGDDSQPTRFSFVEFQDAKSIPQALMCNGIMFSGRPLKINHSQNAIAKPVNNEAKEKELAMKKVKEAEALITASLTTEHVSSRSRRSRSKGSSRRRRSRSRSRSRKHRRRSRSRGHSRKRSKRSRSRSPRRSKRSRSRDRHSRRSGRY